MTTSWYKIKLHTTLTNVHLTSITNELATIPLTCEVQSDEYLTSKSPY